MEQGRATCWDSARDWGFLSLRAALGIIFMAHGGQKLFGWWGGHGFSGTIESFQSGMGIPPVFGALAIIAEFFGGMGVLLGVLTRTAAFGIFVTMIVAAAKVHFQHGFFLATAPGQSNGFEYNFALGAMALFLMLAGPGRYALAGDTERRFMERRGMTDAEPEVVRTRQPA